MTRILYTYERVIPTVAIFRSSTEKSAEKSGREYRFMKITEIEQEDINWCDAFVMIRPNDPLSVHLAKCAQNSGCFVISYFDDDLYSPPKGRPTPFWRISSVRKALHFSNMIWTCSPHIREKYRDYTIEKRAYASDTVVMPDEIKMITALEERTTSPQKIKLIYAANAGHVVFFNQFILPIMPKLCERYAGKISMTFMGVRPELSAFESAIDIEYFSSMPLDEYRKKIQDGNYDIGLAPLTTDEFSKCKYFNKFLEYSMAGIVGMYSNTEPYTYIVKHEKNGFLVNDNPEDWYEALCCVIDDAYLRNCCVRAAQELLLTEFTQEHNEEKEKKAIPELTHYCSMRKPCPSLTLQRLLYRGIPIADKVYKAIYYLYNTGVSGFIKQFKTHMRERKAFTNK